MNIDDMLDLPEAAFESALEEAVAFCIGRAH